VSGPVALPRLASVGHELDTSPEAFGFLRPSGDIVGNAEALQARMIEDGYLFLPGALNRDDVIAARATVTERLAAEGMLDPTRPHLEGALKPETPNPYFRPDLTKKNAALMQVLYDGPMMAIFERLLGGPVRHFDFTWFRAIGPGPGTQPHCDIVYMGRGTRNLYTAWTPLGDIALTVGGLIILEGSHRRSDILGEYLKQDVDTYCENGPNKEKILAGKFGWEHWQDRTKSWSGAITDNPPVLRETLGGRWLTAEEYRMGDVLIFSMSTVHASIDNTTNYIRLSSDTRYQLASEPVDERWIGENPIAHGVAGKRGKIC
jgi:hypothetical protein